MKKLGLWMLAAILLCGSVVTFVACRGNSLEDIIGNSDNTVPEEVIKELLGAIEPNAEIVVKVKYGDNDFDIKLTKDPEENGYTLASGTLPKAVDNTSTVVSVNMTYDDTKNYIIFTLSYNNGTKPYLGIIFDVNNNTYSQVSYQASYEFKSLTVNNEVKAPSDKIKDACPEKAPVLGTTTAPLFYVYYASGETWEDVAKRYTEAFGANEAIKEGTGANTVSLKWEGADKNLYYKDDNSLVHYNYIVGKKADGTTDYEGDNNPYSIYASGLLGTR